MRVPHRSLPLGAHLPHFAWGYLLCLRVPIGRGEPPHRVGRATRVLCPLAALLDRPLRAAPIARATGGMIAGILRGSQDVAGEDLPFDRSSTEVVEDRPS